MCHKWHNLLKVVLQVVEDSELIESSSIIWCILAQSELFQLQGPLTQKSEATLQQSTRQSHHHHSYSVQLKAQIRRLSLAPEEHSNPARVLFSGTHRCLQCPSPSMLEETKVTVLLRSSVLPLSPMLTCKLSHQVPSFTSSKLN